MSHAISDGSRDTRVPGNEGACSARGEPSLPVRRELATKHRAVLEESCQFCAKRALIIAMATEDVLFRDGVGIVF